MFMFFIIRWNFLYENKDGKRGTPVVLFYETAEMMLSYCVNMAKRKMYIKKIQKACYQYAARYAINILFTKK